MSDSKYLGGLDKGKRVSHLTLRNRQVRQPFRERGGGRCAGLDVSLVVRATAPGDKPPNWEMCMAGTVVKEGLGAFAIILCGGRVNYNSQDNIGERFAAPFLKSLQPLLYSKNGDSIPLFGGLFWTTSSRLVPLFVRISQGSDSAGVVQFPTRERDE